MRRACPRSKQLAIPSAKQRIMLRMPALIKSISDQYFYVSKLEIQHKGMPAVPARSVCDTEAQFIVCAGG